MGVVSLEGRSETLLSSVNIFAKKTKKSVLIWAGAAALKVRVSLPRPLARVPALGLMWGK